MDQITLERVDVRFMLEIYRMHMQAWEYELKEDGRDPANTQDYLAAHVTLEKVEALLNEKECGAI